MLLRRSREWRATWDCSSEWSILLAYPKANSVAPRLRHPGTRGEPLDQVSRQSLIAGVDNCSHIYSCSMRGQQPRVVDRGETTIRHPADIDWSTLPPVSSHAGGDLLHPFDRGLAEADTLGADCDTVQGHRSSSRQLYGTACRLTTRPAARQTGLLRSAAKRPAKPNGWRHRGGEAAKAARNIYKALRAATASRIAAAGAPKGAFQVLPRGFSRLAPTTRQHPRNSDEGLHRRGFSIALTIIKAK
jgi:hypothetical protein